VTQSRGTCLFILRINGVASKIRSRILKKNAAIHDAGRRVRKTEGRDEAALSWPPKGGAEL